MKYLSGFICALLMVSACGENKKTDVRVEDSMKISRERLNRNYVDTMVLRPVAFSRQFNCNGKLRAVSKCELTVASGEVLRVIRVHNGSWVNKGDLLALTDTVEARRTYDKAVSQMERSEIDLLDKLIALGYDTLDHRVPEAILLRARISSGWQSASESLEDARRNLEKCFLYAPFSGRVANMDVKPHQRVADVFCVLIDDARFDVEFNILEAELADVEVGERVVVSPFVDDQTQYVGRITEVNPLVDEKGQVKLRAQIENSRHKLVEGMNVHVVVENDLNDLLVVPKSAVVQRDGYSVVFLYREGEAVWTYVDVTQANIGEFAITGNAYKKTTVKAGDVVITSGNLNLADGTPVIPR